MEFTSIKMERVW